MKIWKIESEKQFYDIIIKYDKDKLKLLLDNKENYYGNPIDVPKKNGYRQIYCINKRCDLYRIQKRMVDNFLKNIKVSDRTCGFVKGSSYYDFMEPHKDFYKRNQYLRLDLKNFFGSISKKMVTDCLLYYVDEKIVNRDELIKMIFEILTYNNILIQGAITSPIISNIVFRELDIRIQKYCRKYDIIYTRYADDLLFSGYNSILLKKTFYKGIEKIVGSRGFQINYLKTNRAKEYISLNGFVIDNDIRLSRKKLEEINRIIFFLNRKDELKKIKKGDVSGLNMHLRKETNINTDRFAGKYELLNYLNGYRAFIISAMKYSEDENFLSKSKNKIEKLEDIVNKIAK